MAGAWARARTLACNLGVGARMPSIVARCCSQINKGLHLPHSDWLESRQRKTLTNEHRVCDFKKVQGWSR
jgi:hypothetical protein